MAHLHDAGIDPYELDHGELCRLVLRLRADLVRLREACARQDDEICQVLGKALGYPWFKDDQNNFPGSTDEHGVCVGEHVAVTITAEAAQRLTALSLLAGR